MIELLARMAEDLLDLNQAAARTMLRAGALSMGEFFKYFDMFVMWTPEDCVVASRAGPPAPTVPGSARISPRDSGRDKEKPMADDAEASAVTDVLTRTSMYTLYKAKEEIDAVAKHATDIAAHVLALGDNVDAKLDSFKKEIISTIETKFAELERNILGESHGVETTALADLGAKVSQLLQNTAAPPAHVESAASPEHHEHSGEHDQHQDYQDHHHQ